MARLLERILDVNTDDPEARRRGRFLNVCLLAILLGSATLGLLNLFEFFGGSDPMADNMALYAMLGLIGSLVAFALNKRRLHSLAGYLSLLLIIYLVTSATRPARYIFEGSTILAYVLPIIMASVILAPGSSFVITTVISVVLLVVARLAGITDDPTPETIATLYMLALVAYLSARSLNQALREARERAQELHEINEALDQRVADRTRDLAQANRDLSRALQREHSESSKNQAILSSIADGVIVFDEQGRAVVANPAMERMLVMPMSGILGKDIRELIYTEDDPSAREMIDAAFAKEASIPARFNFEQGKQIIATSLAQVALPGELRGVVGVFHDVTKEVEANRAKSEFVSTVSHELRTPLTSIKGYADLLFMEAVGPLNDRQRNFLNTVKTNADRLNALLNDLLEISRAETGRMRLDVKDMDLAEIIADVANSLRPQIDKKGQQLALELDERLRPVRGDRARLTQVLVNLLSNANRYTPAGGSITVRARQRQNELQVDVVDTGIGISAQDRAKLFQRFFRANDPRVSEVVGTGLGLSITKMLVEMHGGKVWVESTLNAGSTFSFSLPTTPAAGETGPAGAETVILPARPEPKPGAKKVLVVDDDPGIADLIRYYLQSAGHQAVLASRGQEVMAAALREKPDLIILDVLLPDENGFEVLRELKDEPKTLEIPVVILSVIHDQETGFQLGAVDYLVKPLQGEQLLSSIGRIFDEVEPLSPPRILVVDDEPDIRGWLRESLGAAGYVVDEASNGAAALERIAQARPSLILLDLAMPVMDGRTAIRQLKSDKATCDIPIIVLTASSVEKERDSLQLLGMGARRFLTKPISAQMLVEEIQRQL